MVSHAPETGWYEAIVLIVIGLVCIFINYDVDNQKQLFKATDGDCLIWGNRPE